MYNSTIKQPSLFENLDFMDIKFPTPQYLGAKYIHGNWITQHIPDCAKVILDAFSGSQSIGFLCKKLGKTVISNDFLTFNSEVTVEKKMYQNGRGGKGSVAGSSEILIICEP